MSIFALVLLAMIIPVSALAAIQGSFQRTLQVSGPVDLQVLTHSGDITVRAGSPGTVTINAKIHTGSAWLFGMMGGASQADIREIEKNPPIRQTGNMIKIDYPPYKNISIDYDITVPAETTLRTDTGSGNQDVRGLKPAVKLRAGSGDITLNDLAGGAHVETGSGDVRGDNVAGTFDARAGSGDMRVTLAGAGDVRAHTGSGDVQLRNINGGLVIDTGSGDVTAEGQQRGIWNVRTGSGDAHLRVPRDASFDVDVSTASGSVTVDHPVNTTVQGKVAGSSKKRVSGKVGNGGPLMTVHTGSGDVHIY
jgi:hypothetical protein